MSRFIDRSNNNGPVAADNLRKADVRWEYAKATEGTYFKDATFMDRRAQAWSAGAKVGAYHFAALGNAVDECEFFLNFIGETKVGELRPCLDLERGTAVSDIAWAELWVTHFKSRRGYYPALYGSTSLIAPMRAKSAILRSCPWWRAEYGPNDGYLHALAGGALGAAAHQYTSVGHVPGLSGNVDLSVLLSPTALLVPAPPVHHLTPISKRAWIWGRWWLGIGEYKGHGHWAWEHHVPHSAAPNIAGTTAAGRWRAVIWYIRNVLKK